MFKISQKLQLISYDLYTYITIIRQLFIFRIIQFDASRFVAVICTICSKTWIWSRFCGGCFWFWHKKRTYVFVWHFWGSSDAATFLAALVKLWWFLDFVGWLSFWYVFLFFCKRPYRVWIFFFIVKDIHILRNISINLLFFTVGEINISTLHGISKPPRTNGETQLVVVSVAKTRAPRSSRNLIAREFSIGRCPTVASEFLSITLMAKMLNRLSFSCAI